MLKPRLASASHSLAEIGTRMPRAITASTGARSAARKASHCACVMRMPAVTAGGVMRPVWPTPTVRMPRESR